MAPATCEFCGRPHAGDDPVECKACSWPVDWPLDRPGDVYLDVDEVLREALDNADAMNIDLADAIREKVLGLSHFRAPLIAAKITGLVREHALLRDCTFDESAEMLADAPWSLRFQIKDGLLSTRAELVRGSDGGVVHDTSEVDAEWSARLDKMFELFGSLRVADFDGGPVPLDRHMRHFASTLEGAQRRMRGLAMPGRTD